MDSSEKTITLKTASQSDWGGFIKKVVKADEILSKHVDENGYLILDLELIIHNLTWHQYKNAAHWIVDNPDLVERIANSSNLSRSEHEELMLLYDESLRKLSR